MDRRCRRSGRAIRGRPRGRDPRARPRLDQGGPARRPRARRLDQRRAEGRPAAVDARAAAALPQPIGWDDMKPPASGGILLYRRLDGGLEVLLAHPGGPFWTNRDAGAWT